MPVGLGPVSLSWRPAAPQPTGGNAGQGTAPHTSAAAATDPEHCIQFVLRLLGEHLLGREASLVQVGLSFGTQGHVMCIACLTDYRSQRSDQSGSKRGETCAFICG